MPKIRHVELLPKQRQFTEAIEPELLYSGAWGAGKSRALCQKALLLAQLYPGSTIGICRKTLKALKATTLQTFLNEVCPRDHILRYNRTDNVITVKSGPLGRQTSRILFFGLKAEDGESYSIRSLNLGACGVDEVVELEEAEWDELGGRLRDPACKLRQLFGATNPANRGHWCYQRFFLRPSPGIHRTIETNALENPHLPADYVARIARLKGRYYDRYVLGKWVDFEGLVYDNFDPLVHLISWDDFAKRFGTRAIPPDWARVAGIDFGYANPFVYQWWAISPDGEWYRYRELYHTRRIVSTHAMQIRDVEQYEAPIRYSDHDAEDRATLDAEGFPTIAARKEISPGIQTVYGMLAVRPEIGRPKAYWIRDALLEEDPYLRAEGLPTCSEEEMQSYRYPRGTTRLDPKEDPVKKGDHGVDAVRYAMHTHLVGVQGEARALNLGAAPRHRVNWSEAFVP